MKRNALLLALCSLLLLPLMAATKKERKILKNNSTAMKTNSSKSSVKMSNVKSKTSRGKLEAWIAQMKKRIAKSQASHNQLVAVAAVRGDETSDAPPLYWKGKMAKGEVEMPELAEFEAAIDSALQDDDAVARQKLESFISNHPKSALVADAQETLKRFDDSAPTP